MPLPRRVTTALVALVVAASCRSGEARIDTLTRETGPPGPDVTAGPADTTVAPATTVTTIPTVDPPATTAKPAGSLLSSARVVVSPSGVVLPVLSHQGAAVQVGTPCGGSARLTQATPVEGSVVLDAGHGGGEPGAAGPVGTAERDVNLAVVSHAKSALEAAGVATVLTRSANYRMTLEARAQVVKALRPRAFVSVHHNADPDGPRPTPGSETYYQVASPESKRLAGLVYEEVVKALNRYELTWVGDTDAGAKYRRNTSGDDYYGILRRTQGTPAALAELAFISNPPEEALLVRADVQVAEGQAVARGILRFLNSKDLGSGFTEPYARSTPAGPGGGGAGCVDPQF